jgi:Exostosin family
VVRGIGHSNFIVEFDLIFSLFVTGDNLFSYRFTEIISCGSIPVVYADDWLLPFGKDLIDWTEAAVVIPEAETLDTVNILSKISVEKRCRMRQKVYEVYRKYMQTGRGVIQGIIENFELSHAAESGFRS